MAGLAKDNTRQSDAIPATAAPPQLLAFQAASFDPAQYLNQTLPPLLTSSTRSHYGRSSTAASLPDLSGQTQTLLAQLNAQLSRLSATLTQLTDEILRTGGRLAYEVEVLRGDTITLADALDEGLQADIARFLPPAPNDAEDGHSSTANSAAQLPPYMSQLKTLSLVRERLDSVIKVFDEAMKWILPPSELSLASTLISVSAPDREGEEGNREQKGREYAENMRNEIQRSNVEDAHSRIEALRTLVQVWKGTAEEKARLKFVDGLIRLVEEKQRNL
ncbi:MAG: hypothetical protein M1820_010314 [Bogoriella megaspora]|nr:MAG: hypothetical protein M1820_010314 [Bogoriella megaspora]